MLNNKSDNKQDAEPKKKKEFVVTYLEGYVGFHSTNLKCPLKGFAKDGVVDCARMLAEEFGTDNIRIAANVKDIFKYGIEFRDLTPKDQIYVNKLKYMLKLHINKEEIKKRNLDNMKVLINA